MQVSEVAAAAAGDADLLARGRRVVEQQHLAPALARDAGAEQPGAAGAEDDGVVGLGCHYSIVMLAPDASISGRTVRDPPVKPGDDVPVGMPGYDEEKESHSKLPRGDDQRVDARLAQAAPRIPPAQPH